MQKINIYNVLYIHTYTLPCKYSTCTFTQDNCRQARLNVDAGDDVPKDGVDAREVFDVLGLLAELEEAPALQENGRTKPGSQSKQNQNGRTNPDSQY